jgi:hypothetical protein
MNTYDDFANIVALVLKISGATWGLWLLGYVLVYSVRTLINGPKQSVPVPQKAQQKARPEARPVKAYWLEIKETRGVSPWDDAPVKRAG